MTTTTTITLQQFHNLLADAYAVTVNDRLYFVGYDTDDNPYIANDYSDDYLDLSAVDGDIELHEHYVFFNVQDEAIQMSFLHIQKLS